MTVTKFVRQVQLAERLTQTGRGATTLHLESRVAEELGVGLAGLGSSTPRALAISSR